jgi:hypothetical protein
MTLKTLLSSLVTIGFSGSRSLQGPGLDALVSLFRLIPIDCRGVVGCALGADAAVKAEFDGKRNLSVISVGSGLFSSGKAAYARRSMAVVESLSSNDLLIVVPDRSCPPLVAPSRSFRGYGSGTWGTAAYALGTDRRILLWSPSTPPPAWKSIEWNYLDGWYLGSKKASYYQSSLF